jgi:Secretion system C-terminal sorting domain
VLRIRLSRPVAPAVVLLFFWCGAAWGHFEADGLVVTVNGQPIVHVWQGNVTGFFEVPYASPTATMDVTFLDPDSVPFQPDTSDAYIRSLIEAPGTVFFQQVGQWSFKLTGLQEGAASNIRLRLWFFDHYDYTSPAIPYIVDIVTGIRTPGLVPGPVLETFPNPIRSTGEVHYTLNQSGPTALRLYDVAGRLVRSIDERYRGPGDFLVPFDTGGLASGVYFLRLDSPNGLATRKVHILR